MVVILVMEEVAVGGVKVNPFLDDGLMVLVCSGMPVLSKVRGP
jgi:hypothetical protein